MKSIWTGIQLSFSALGGFIGWFLGGVDGFLYALIAFAVIDYITGVMCAVSDKKLDSKVGFKGICRKVLIFTLVGCISLCFKTGDYFQNKRGRYISSTVLSHFVFHCYQASFFSSCSAWAFFSSCFFWKAARSITLGAL